jgi:hypothetical protein
LPVIHADPPRGAANAAFAATNTSPIVDTAVPASGNDCAPDAGLLRSVAAHMPGRSRGSIGSHDSDHPETHRVPALKFGLRPEGTPWPLCAAAYDSLGPQPDSDPSQCQPGSAWGRPLEVGWPGDVIAGGGGWDAEPAPGPAVGGPFCLSGSGGGGGVLGDCGARVGGGVGGSGASAPSSTAGLCLFTPPQLPPDSEPPAVTVNAGQRVDSILSCLAGVQLLPPALFSHDLDL